jgi:thymidylate synthase (FAD)
MRIIEPSWCFEEEINPKAIMEKIERAGRTCYKSEGRIGDGTAEKFIAGIIRRGHEAVLEHASISVRIICDRGVSHEIVRHRLAAYCQESTRYCNYADGKFGGELTFIKPCYWKEKTDLYDWWERAMMAAEDDYKWMLHIGATPEQARSILPNSLKTELVMTANLREWRTIFKLRTSPAAHPQMREIAGMMLEGFRKELPVLFGDIGGSEDG